MDMKTIFYFITLTFLLCTSIYAQSSLNNKYTENGILSYPQWQPELVIGRMDKMKISPFLKYLKTPPNEFEIDPKIKNLVTGQKGIRLNIPENAFVYSNNKIVSGKVKIRLIEVIDIFDFITTGVGLVYFDKIGRENLFESGGMFKVEAIQGTKKLFLAKGKEIEVMLPDLFPSTKFQMFSMDKDGKWILKDKNPLRMAKENITDNESYVAQNSEEGAGTPAADMEYEINQIGVIVTSIDGLGWINADYPHPKFSCLKGEIQFVKKMPAKVVNVLAFGMDHRSIISNWTATKKFEINVLKDKKIKILAIDNRGNVGVSEIINTPKESGHSKNPESPKNFKLKIKDIVLQKVNHSLFTDQEKFKEYLGISDEHYMIRYPTKKEVEPLE